MKKYLLNYSIEATENPTLARAVLETGVLVNILVAKVDTNETSMLISIDGDENDEEKIIGYLMQQGVDAKKIEGNICKDEDQCIDCGSCFSVCPTRAITLKDRRMVLDNQECICCLACIPACPVKALSEQL